jgi:hypothetical protein
MGSSRVSPNYSKLYGCLPIHWRRMLQKKVCSTDQHKSSAETSRDIPLTRLKLLENCVNDERTYWGHNMVDF